MCPLQVEQEWSDQVPHQEGRVQPQETQWDAWSLIMAKPILLSEVEYAMLSEVAKKQRQKPEQYLKNLIRESYDKRN